MQNSKTDIRSKWFFYFAMAWIGYRFWGNTLFSQLAEPVLIYPDVDNTFWMLHLLNIPDFITKHPLATTIADMSLLFLPMLYLKTKNKWFAVGYTFMIGLYIIVFSTYSCHHLHSFMGLFIVSIPFWTTNETRHQRLWEAARYYFLFAMVSAALWKISRGGLFNPDQMVNILKAQHAQYLSEYQGSSLSGFYLSLIHNQPLAQSIYWISIIIEFSFLAGFFTKKLDKILLGLFTLFLITNFLVMGIFSFELSVFGILLLL